MTPIRTVERFADRRWLALVVLCAGMLMIILDGTIVNVALPSIQADLGFTQATLAWVVNAYLIAFGGVMLLAGRLGDLLGRRRIFLAGLAVFTLASAVCGLSVSQSMLIGARFVQGLGGAMTSSVILGMIVTMFRERRERSRAIGIYSFVASAGASIGLLAGGVLIQALNWHWIFFVNLPIGIVTAASALRLLEDDEGIGMAGGADALGALLVTAGLMVAAYAIITASGVPVGQALAFGAVAVLLLGAFVVREARIANPLLPLSVFRSRNVSGANAVQVLMVASMFGTFFLGTLYLERIAGFDALEIGLAFLPVSLGIGGMSLWLSEPLITRFGARGVLLPGLALLAAGLAWLARLPVAGSYGVDVLPSLLVFGIGAGLAFPALMTLAMSGAAEHESGLLSGLVNATQQVGGALGLAVLAAAAASRTQAAAAAGSPPAVALTDGFRFAFATAAGLALASVLIAAAVLRAPASEPAEASEPDDEALAA